MEDIKYEVSIRKDKSLKNLYFYEAKVDETVLSGQAFGVGDAMLKIGDHVFRYLEDQGKVK